MKDRIFSLIEAKELALGKFADEIGVERSTMSHIKSDRSKPSLDMAQKILERYPEVSVEWLILGQGPMFKHINDSQEPDLFSQLELNTSKSDMKSEKVEPIITVQTPPRNQEIETPDIVVAKKEEQRVVSTNSINSERIVERVIIFYSDQTFEELKK